VLKGGQKVLGFLFFCVFCGFWWVFIGGGFFVFLGFRVCLVVWGFFFMCVLVGVFRVCFRFCLVFCLVVFVFCVVWLYCCGLVFLLFGFIVYGWFMF